MVVYRNKEIAAIFGLFLTSFVSLLAFGVNTDSYLTYNIYYWSILSNPAKFVGTPLDLVLSNDVLLWFGNTFHLLLVSPHWVVVSGLTLNTVGLYVGYMAAKSELNHQYALLLAVISGIVVHGYLPGFDSSEIIFGRKSVVEILLIVSIFTMVRHYLFGLLVVATIGVALHPLDMLSGLFFLLPGYFYFLFFHIRNQFGRGLLFIVAFLAMVLVQYLLLSGNNDESGVPVTEWYRFALLIEVGDVALFELIRSTIGISGSVVVVATALSWTKKSEKNILDLFCLSFLPLIGMVLILEWVHFLGFSMPIISELFIGIQFRRGFWIVSLISLVKILSVIFSEYREVSSLKKIMAGSIISAILVHSLPVSLLGLTAFYFFQKGQNNRLVELALVTGAILLVIQGWQTIDNIRWFGELMKIILFVFLIGFWVVIVNLKIKNAYVLVVGLYSIVAVGKNNFVDNIFLGSWSDIYQVKQNDSVESISTLLISKNANARQREEMDVLAALNRYDGRPSSGVLFAAVGTGYGAPVIAEQRMLFTRWDNTLMFSKTLYVDYKERLADLGVDGVNCNSMYGTGISCFMEEIGKRIDEMNLVELSHFGKKYGIDYVVRRKELNAEEIYRNNQYFVYQITN